jgi:transcriptional regulator with XRE-family HTH domain
MARDHRSHVGSGIHDGGPSQLVNKQLTKQEFGQRLHRLLLEKGWTQSELARRAGLPRDSISVYMNARSLPTPLSLQKLSDALNVPADDLLPNYAINAIQKDFPELEIRVSANDRGKAYLQINRWVPTSIALQIAGLLDQADRAPAQGG